MRELSRYGSCIALACALVLAASAALAEERKAGPTAPTGKGAPAPKAYKWYVPEQDSDSSSMRQKGGVKTPSVQPRKR